MENRSSFDTDDVLQIYIRDLESPFETPHPHLAAFRRIHLDGNEKLGIKIPLRADCFTVVDETGRRFRDGKRYEIFAGFSQPDTKSKELTGKEPIRIEYNR